MESARDTVARNLRRMRSAHGLSQEELAHLAGVDRSYISLLETGSNSASVDMLERLGKALGVSVARFLEPKATRSR